MIDYPILITGCPRSGTSMTAGIIEKCGAFGGTTVGPTHNNQKGMFENLEIRNTCIKPFLASVGADKMGQSPLPDIEVVNHAIKVRDGFVASWKGKLTDIIRRHGYTESGRWYFKDPKICLFWPLWNAAFPKADWVIVRRNTKDIVRSCMRTHFMRAYRHESGWLSWVDVHKERFIEMQQNCESVNCIWPQDWIDGDYSHIRELILKLGLTWNTTVIRSFVSPDLWRGQSQGDKA